LIGLCGVDRFIPRSQVYRALRGLSGFRDFETIDNRALKKLLDFGAFQSYIFVCHLRQLTSQQISDVTMAANSYFMESRAFTGSIITNLNLDFGKTVKSRKSNLK
jgi:hypothetical protein